MYEKLVHLAQWQRWHTLSSREMVWNKCAIAVAYPYRYLNIDRHSDAWRSMHKVLVHKFSKQCRIINVGERRTANTPFKWKLNEIQCIQFQSPVASNRAFFCFFSLAIGENVMAAAHQMQYLTRYAHNFYGCVCLHSCLWDDGHAWSIIK